MSRHQAFARSAWAWRSPARLRPTCRSPEADFLKGRRAGPGTADYRVVPGSEGKRRDFRISVGLREGWDDEGGVFDVSEAVPHRACLDEASRRGRSAGASGMFARAEVTYAWPRPDGTLGSDREPVALFTGEAVHLYLGHLPDAEIEAMLN